MDDRAGAVLRATGDNSVIGPAVSACFVVFCLFLLVGKRARIGVVIGAACLAAVPLSGSPVAHLCTIIAAAALAVDVLKSNGLTVTDVSHPRTENVLSAVRRAPLFTPQIALARQPAQEKKKKTEAIQQNSSPEALQSPEKNALGTPAAASGAGEVVAPAASAAAAQATPMSPDLHSDDSVPLPMSLPRASPGSSDKHSFVALPTIVNKVRGVDYMADGVKVAPEPPLFECVNVDCFYCDSKTPGLLSNPSNFYPKARAAGDDRFYFIMHYATPPKPLMHMVMYFAVDPARLDSSPEFARLWSQFLTGDDAWRNERLKIIPNVAEAPWAVRWAVGGSKPVLLARRLKHTYTIDEANKVVLASCDVESSSWASGIVGTLRGNISHVVIDLGFTFEGRASNELPERIIGAGQLRYINLKSCSTLEQQH